MQTQLFEWIARFSYPAVLLLLASSGVGAPVNEDVVLLLAGVVVSTGRAVLPVMMAVAWLGVVVGDTALFRIGARLGPKVIEHRRLKRVLTASRVAWVKGKFDRFGAWTVFAVCFLPGLRLPTFLLAGSFGVTQKRFWAAEMPAVAVYAPLLVWVGATFGAAALPYVKQFGLWALAVVAAGVLTAILVGQVRRRLKRRAA